MNPQEMRDDLKEWQGETGLTKKPAPGLKIEELASIIDYGLDGMSLQELELLMARIASYNIFLKTEKGRLASRLAYLGDQLKRSLYLETQRLGAEYKYNKIEEKEAIVLANNPDISELKKQVLLAEIKFNQIKDIPHSIDKKLEILVLIYNRKIKNG